MRAYSAFIVDLDSRLRNEYSRLIPQLLDIYNSMVMLRDDDLISDALNIYIDLAEHIPKLFRPILTNMIDITIKILSSQEFEDRVRHLAIELLLTLSEMAPNMMKRVPNFSANLKMMSEIEDDKDWYTTLDLDHDNQEDYIIGEQAMDRLARTLGGELILPVSFQYIPRMLQSEHWQQRHAALMAISAIAEGCADLMERELGKVIE
jgi:hypothetical protein